MAARRLRKVGMVASAQGVPAARSIQRARLWARQARPSQAAFGGELARRRVGEPAGLTPG
ncbi:MAG: hypothetical protein BRC31_04380 [Actinobacteria bacterium QS_5_72_10]|nr:MAG: hypothetical protein BRC31_04380 [Actinobacteria bacterium QS_5_72_10]